jgi:hypothetical protein|tara:strand:- start:929 stop:1135 length:207 start_codon:yes stop_codon:yes gene_type:complete
MCVPGAYGQAKQSAGAKMKPGSLGYKLDQSQRTASANAGGGTNGSTILNGTPRNSGVDALRKTTFLGV